MSGLPLISVIVPNFNHSKFLTPRIDSILSQSYANFEVIILDDCSTDNSREIIESYRKHPRVKEIIYNSFNTGAPLLQWLTGFKNSSGDWIWVAESDDLSDSKFLEVLASFIQPGIDIIFCRSNFIDENSDNIDHEDFFKRMFPQKWGYSYLNDGLREIKESFLYFNIIGNTSSAIFRRPKKFPPNIYDFRFSWDWYFWIFLLKEGGQIQFVAETLNSWRFHSSTTRAFSSSALEIRRFQEYWKCVSFASDSLYKRNKTYFSIGKYDWICEDATRRAKKIGLLSKFALFPPLPFRMLSKYYKHYFSALLLRLTAKNIF